MMTGTERDDLPRRRAAARRTAWILAAIAVAIFGAFVLSGILGR
jgi:hypothetical protein